MSRYIPKHGDIAEATIRAFREEKVTGKVVAVGKTYADVKWHTSDRIERVHFRNPNHGVTFKPADTN